MADRERIELIKAFAGSKLFRSFSVANHRIAYPFTDAQDLTEDSDLGNPRDIRFHYVCVKFTADTTRTCMPCGSYLEGSGANPIAQQQRIIGGSTGG